ncbi:helix-turn-helix transcriptional regulator [Flavobacterium limnophilum]|uniref:helix-turn-helix transcriptional regulator n=1 Tax=Flavobacterium limnophilum TaxID=3003262 RepID=UPI0024822978|nr:WYL domain-containing protein [Flavobacterium limnophilum]
MEDYGKKKIYKKIIVKLLREKNLNVEELLTSLNEILKTDYGMDGISRRTFDRAKESLLENGYTIKSRKFEGKSYFVLEGHPENLNLTEEEQLTLPLLLGLLDTEKTMNSVEWIKSVLMDEFDYSEEDLNPHPHFVHIEPALNSQDQLLILAGRIIEYIKKGQAIKFLYDKKGIATFKQVAPLQIRYYDNRYYLLGTDIDENTNEAEVLLKNYTLDKFMEKQVYPAILEDEDNDTVEKYIYFDYQELYKNSNLEYLLNNSLGIWYDKENILKTFKLKFTDWAMGIVENKKIHHSQRIIEKRKDFTILEISVWDNREIDFFVGRFGNKCERLN